MPLASPGKQKVETKTWGILTRFICLQFHKVGQVDLVQLFVGHLDPKVHQAICDFTWCFQMWRDEEEDDDDDDDDDDEDDDDDDDDVKQLLA